MHKINSLVELYDLFLGDFIFGQLFVEPGGDELL